ncbi:unnamed protein product [Amoebophrya sp. A120]|nr:unnamed protein product [Amoebophrya sp. A120]|eukprot:GSA120T00007698001.1
MSITASSALISGTSGGKMNVLNGILTDLYMVFLLLAIWELIFGHDLLFQPARVALVAITVVLLFAIPYRSLTSSSTENAGAVQRRRPFQQQTAQGLPRVEKTTKTGSINGLEYASSEMQGWRPAMEDAACAEDFSGSGISCLQDWAFFGVFDGHGGAAVSRRISTELHGHFCDIVKRKYSNASSSIEPEQVKYALGEAFAMMDLALRRESVNGEFDFVGSTGIVVVLSGRDLVCANVGDSRALLARDNKCLSLSEDHKPEMPQERKRIEKAGGSVAQIGPCYRVDGWGLNLSRAFGDFHYKGRPDLEPWEQKVSAEPEIRILPLHASTDNYLVLGCDGVFELLKNQDVIDFVCETTRDGSSSISQVVESLLDQCISPNLLVTQGKGGDNVSAIVIRLEGAIGTTATATTNTTGTSAGGDKSDGKVINRTSTTSSGGGAKEDDGGAGITTTGGGAAAPLGSLAGASDGGGRSKDA